MKNVTHVRVRKPGVLLKLDLRARQLSKKPDLGLFV